LIKWFHYFTLKSRKNFIRRFLKANGVDYYSQNATPFDTESLRTFVDQYCRQDGILLLRIITANMNTVIVGELICALWENWQIQRQIRIQTLSQDVHHSKAKYFDDHDHNQSISSRAPMLNHDERYVLFPTKL